MSRLEGRRGGTVARGAREPLTTDAKSILKHWRHYKVWNQPNDARSVQSAHTTWEMSLKNVGEALINLHRAGYIELNGFRGTYTLNLPKIRGAR